ncbi:hypothetical protein YQE_04188, partial [Dendroctonus ponderosae]
MATITNKFALTQQQLKTENELHLWEVLQQTLAINKTLEGKIDQLELKVSCLEKKELEREQTGKDKTSLVKKMPTIKGYEYVHFVAASTRQSASPSPSTSKAIAQPCEDEYHTDEEELAKETEWIRTKHNTKKRQMNTSPNATPPRNNETKTKK